MDSYSFLTGLRWQDVLDIALLSYILFRLYILFRGTYVSRVIAGLAVIWCVQEIAQYLGLIVTSWIMQDIIAVAALIIIIIFRNDGFRKDAGHLAKRAFGDLGHAGGHEGAARAEIPLDGLQKIGISGYGAGVETFIRKRLKL